MTIAAGFYFDKGVLLCADSQIMHTTREGEVYKTPGNKVFYYDLAPNPLRLGFAIAGDVSRAKKGIQRILLALGMLDLSNANKDQVFKTMEKAHEKHYDRVFKHPRFIYGTGPDYHLLISASLKGETALFVTREDVFDAVDKWDCVGSGETLFRYLFGRLYADDLTLDEIVILAVHAVEQLKSCNPTIGFHSEFMLAWHGDHPFSNIVGYDVDHVEKFSNLVVNSMFRVMFTAANLKYSEEQVKSAHQLFQDNLTNLRRKYQEDRNQRDAIRRILAILEEHRKIEVTLTIPKGASSGSLEIKGKEKWR